MASDGYVSRLNSVEYAARDERLLDSVLQMPAGSGAFSARGGRRVHAAGLQASVGGSPEAVTVTAGAGLVSPAAGSTGGYAFAIPASVSVVLPARPSTGLSRIDLVVARIYDVDESVGSTREVKIEHVPGTPSGSPSAPATPSLSLVLATLNVPSSGTISVTQSTTRTVAAGGVLPVATTAERDALTPYAGLVVHNAQAGGLQVHDGTAWRTVTPDQPRVGTASQLCTNADTTYTGTITFSPPFPSGVTPKVIVSVPQTGAPQARFAGVTSVTNTGFTFVARSTVGGQTVSADYVAYTP